ncbi:MAG: DUF1428 domain-containing protein [Pseudomonadota bacterium]
MYIEGFVLPVKTAGRDQYITEATYAADLFLGFGATRVVEAWADDAPVGEVTSFPRAVQLEEDETAVFSWIEYPDKSTRDACNAKVMEDEKMKEQMENGLIAGRRMIYGGFTVLLDKGRGA